MFPWPSRPTRVVRYALRDDLTIGDEDLVVKRFKMIPEPEDKPRGTRP
jgi:hypothetical protein